MNLRGIGEKYLKRVKTREYFWENISSKHSNTYNDKLFCRVIEEFTAFLSKITYLNGSKFTSAAI